jgi:hypothetical protein
VRGKKGASIEASKKNKRRVEMSRSFGRLRDENDSEIGRGGVIPHDQVDELAWFSSGRIEFVIFGI